MVITKSRSQFAFFLHISLPPSHDMNPTSKTHWKFNMSGHLVSAEYKLGFVLLFFFCEPSGQTLCAVCLPVTCDHQFFLPFICTLSILMFFLHECRLLNIYCFLRQLFQRTPHSCVWVYVLCEGDSGSKTELCVCLSVTMSDRNRSELVIFHPYLSFSCVHFNTQLCLDDCQCLF